MQDSNNVYIGRRGIVFIESVRYPPNDSVWCNPFKIGKDGTREEVLSKYEQYIIMKINSGILNLDILRGKTLGCWCKPEACHGDILIRLLEEKLTV